MCILIVGKNGSLRWVKTIRFVLEALKFISYFLSLLTLPYQISIVLGCVEEGTRENNCACTCMHHTTWLMISYTANTERSYYKLSLWKIKFKKCSNLISLKIHYNFLQIPIPKFVVMYNRSVLKTSISSTNIIAQIHVPV